MVKIKTKTNIKLDQAELQNLESMFGQQNFVELDRRLRLHIQNNPGAFFLYNILGLSQLRQSKFADSIASYSKVLEFQSDHIEAYYNSGIGLFNLGRFNEAIQYFNKVQELNPDFKGVYKSAGAACNNLEKFEDAVSNYLKALEQDPDDVELYRNLGISYDNLQEYEQAQRCYQKALVHNSGDVQIYSRYGYSLVKSGRDEAAIAVLQEGLNNCSDHYDFHAILGAAYNNLGNYDAAVECFEKAVKLGVDNPTAYTNICSALINQERFEEALFYYDHALEVFPDNALFHYLKANVYRQLQRYEAAVPYYSRVVKLEPDNEKAFFYLGVCYFELGNTTEAISCYERSIEIKKDFVNAYVNLGITYKKLGNGYKAAQIFQLAIEIDEGAELALKNFAETVRTLHEIKISPSLRKHIKLCLSSPKVASIAINSVVNILLAKDFENYFSKQTLDLDDLREMHNISEGLLALYLKYSIVNDIKIEKLISKVRNCILASFCKEGVPVAVDEDVLPILEGLGFHGFRNEYIWHTTDEEYGLLEGILENTHLKIKNNEGVDKESIFVLAAYMPLSELSDVRAWGHRVLNDVDGDLEELLRVQVIEPEIERKLAENITQFTSIDDSISTAVQEQYEENPYPRWDSLTYYSSEAYTSRIKFEIEPYGGVLVPVTDNPQVLVAGGGTGKHPISCALQYRNSNILAVDLSRASLSYAIRKSQEMNVSNIDFGQADILKLGELNRTFDVIECCGVLHHMEDPEAGLKVLLSLLNPGGYIKIALYSEIARSAIAELRAKIAGQNVDMSRKGLQQFRYELQFKETEIYNSMFAYNDIYSMSSFRDLILHVQEHRFTISQLKSMLERHSLNFLGFNIVDPRSMLSYIEEFPDDPDCIDLDNWENFEKEKPQTFAGMYTFWCNLQG